MSVFIRIALRYLAGALVAYGWLAPDEARIIAGDPEFVQAVEMAIGALLAVSVEVFYMIAKRAGWRT